MRLFPSQPPPGAPDESSFFSPLRGPWLTTILGLALLALMTIVIVTGFLSHAAYNPDLGTNALIPRGQDFQPLIFAWPASPTWLYRVTQGLHVTVGIVAVPLLLTKLWSVIPRLFTWPPVSSPAHSLERISLLALVGGAIFQLGTGIFNVQMYYPWHFSFLIAHYYGAWVFSSALVLHVAVKIPTMRKALSTRRALAPLIDSTPEPYEEDGLAPQAPEHPSISRKSFFGLVGAAMGGLLVVTAGQSIGPLRRFAVLAPRSADAFPVNKSAALARVTAKMAGPSWRLSLRAGGKEVASLSRAQLLAMEQHTYDLPIACVEGWSSQQRWTGVRLADLAARAGLPDAGTLHVVSLQPQGAFNQTTLGRNQVHADQSLLALKVNGADLSLDHGFPARIIVPAQPGVHNTKWISRLEFS